MEFKQAGLGVGVPAGVGVPPGVTVAVGVAVGVPNGVTVGTAVGVGEGVGARAHTVELEATNARMPGRVNGNRLIRKVFIHMQKVQPSVGSMVRSV